MAEQATRQLRVWRGDAAGGGLADYTVPVQEGEVVLDVLHRLQATQDGDLAIRWNCKAGKCGSCSAEINGQPKLLCMTRLSPLPGGPVTITPLRTYPVVRDLVTDVSANYGWALHVPSFALPDGLKPGGYRIQQADIGRGQEFRKCIECWLCQDVCHVIRDHEDNKPVYAGPRYFIRHAELDMHPLDARDRREVLRGRVRRSWRREDRPRHDDEKSMRPNGAPGPPPRPTGRGDSTAKEDLAMRVDYHKVFPGGKRAMAELERAVHSAALEQELLELVRVRASQINGWNRLAVGLRSDVLSLDGLSLPGNADAAGSA